MQKSSPVANLFSSGATRPLPSRFAHRPFDGVLSAFSDRYAGLMRLLFAALMLAILFPTSARAANEFAATGSMTSGRHLHNATRLGDETVLITGGYSGGTALSSAELYNPATKTFSATTGAMAEVRAQHTATRLVDGTVLITGGINNNNATALSSAELYNPTTKTFSATTGAMGSARRFHAATLLSDGTVLITGGISNSSSNLSSAEIYNPTSKTFSATTSPMTSVRYFHLATSLSDGTVLITGGNTGGNAVASAELYNVGAKTFSATTGAMTQSRQRHTATPLGNGTVLITGGQGNGGNLSSAELYNVNAKTFSATTGVMAEGRFAHTATLLGDSTVLVAGGSSNSGASSSAELYNLASQNFSAAPNTMTSARSGHTATLLNSGTVLVAGGESNGSSLSSADLYGPAAPTIISFTPVSGTVSTNVVITGTNFIGASSVKFNSTTALNYLVNSATQITASVPTGASTGKITVTTPDGIAISAANFTVLPSATTGAIISEFRFRGTTSDDEYVEIYNTTNAPLNLSGWSIIVESGVGMSLNRRTAMVPAGTLVPAYGHFLFASAGYSLTSFSANDTSIGADANDASGVALFSAAGTKQDAAGFTASASDLREGAGLSSAPNTNGTASSQSAFMRRFKGQLPVDTGDNAADFLLLSTDGAAVAGTSIAPQLGAPNPEGLASPVNINAQIGVRVLDANFGPNVSPNRIRIGSGNGGSLVFRRYLKNNTNQPLSRIRLLVTDITGQVSPVVTGQADVRLTSQANENVAVAGQGTVLVYGTTLEAPSNLPSGTSLTTVGGGGIGSSVNYDIVLTTPLAVGAERPYTFNVQVAKTGSFFININLLGK